MSEQPIPDSILDEVRRGFGLGEPLEVTPLGNGHIHVTLAIRWRDEQGTIHESVVQRLNEHVFPDLDRVMSNMQRVTAHPGVEAWVPPLLRTPEGEVLVRDSEGRRWRAFERVPGGTSYDMVSDPALAREGARAFAAFAFGLEDLGDPPLHDPLPGFHDTVSRLRRFEAVHRQDLVGRAASIAAEFEALSSRNELATALVRHDLPLRVTHNDTKLNNVLFDSKGKAVAVVDLDTVAPGLLAWDFGDLVRSATNTAPEDADADQRVAVDRTLFRALAEGWVEGAAGRMTEAEVATLVLSGQVMTFELALRFGTDWLEGDPYFRIKDEEHNLRRLRVQLDLLASMEESREEMEADLADALRRV